MLEITYTGTDVVIPKDTIEDQLGYRPGDKLRVLIHGKVKLVPIVRLPDDTDRMRAGLDAVAGSWSMDDVAHFHQWRQELWAEWQIRESV